MNSTSQMSCSLVFSQQPPYMCHLPVHHCTDPLSWGCIFKCAGWYDKEWGLGSRVYIPTCLPVAHDEDEGSLLLSFRCVSSMYYSDVVLVFETMQVVRILILVYLDQRCNKLILLLLISILCTVVLSVIQGIALNTGVQLWAKSGALQNGIRA